MLAPYHKLHILQLSTRTRRQTLLQLIRLFRIFEDERIEESMTSDFEFDLVGRFVAFYAARCTGREVSKEGIAGEEPG